MYLKQFRELVIRFPVDFTHFIRIKYLAACGRGPQNTVSGPGLALGFDTNRGPTKWGFIKEKKFEKTITHKRSRFYL